MVQFNTLRLSGFKSFVDKTEIDIAPGLNGIVGPNGCGKSNLVEALRWVMGGSSAKSFRTGVGSSMDDVIFAGTAKRPARNAASVQLLLDNSALTAPYPFDKSPDIQIERQIQRDKGSTYRVNGKTVRARDVQTLFADSLTGANSPALVSQGRITRIIEAKPVERRAMLEESAGVAGLFTRRREAQLRLKAAEENLQRAQDQCGHLNQNLTVLLRQAKQAVRYRDLGQQIRNLDLAILWHNYQGVRRKLDAITTKFDAAEKHVQETMLAATHARTNLGKKQTSLPDLREQLTKAQAAEQRVRLEYQRLVDSQEAERHRLEEQKRQIAQLTADKQAGTAELTRLEAIIAQDQKELLAQQEALIPFTQSTQELKTELDTTRDHLQSLESSYDAQEQERLNHLRLQERQTNQIDNLTRQVEDLSNSKQRLESQLDEVQQEQATLPAIDSMANDVETIKNQSSALNDQLSAIQDDIEGAQITLSQHQQSHDSAQEKISDKEHDINKLNFKINALLENQTGITNDLEFAAQYANAVQVTFGEHGLNAGLDSDAASYWDAAHINAQQGLAAPLTALSDHVTGPDALAFILNNTAICDDLPMALSLKPHLKPGQAIVTLEGDLLRHDGLHIKATGQRQGEAGFLIELQARLKLLKDEAQNLQQQAQDLPQQLSHAQQRLEALKHRRHDLNQQKSQLETSLHQAERELMNTQNKHSQHQSRIDDLQQRIQNAGLKAQSLQGQLKDIQAEKSKTDAHKTNNGPQADKSAIIDMRSKLEGLRVQLTESERAAAQTQSAIERVCARIDAHRDMLSAAKSRLLDTDRRLEKQSSQAQQHNTLSAEDVEASKNRLTVTLDEHTQQTTSLRETIATMELEERELSDLSRNCDTALSDAREARALLSAELSNTQQQFEDVHTDIAENYAFTPQTLEAAVIESFDRQIPDQAELKTLREQYIHRRESLGAVNLRAEEEAQTLAQELEETEKEVRELDEAITQLHQGINKLNKEARARMIAAFDDANKHFQSLFQRLFQGGEAHLQWVDSQDPLLAGIDIQAQPPGKALQSLSLLSGGEQTLTATALIFGMFLSSPSPICVLDEIDAPLDDGNVERICDLLEHLARTSHTRFLIITHHRMTMARMDRLYGVTMSENGVSKLVSVDLNDQEQMSLLSDDDLPSMQNRA